MRYNQQDSGPVAENKDASGAEADVLPGVVAALGELAEGAIVFEEGLAHLFGRHPVSIKRAVERGELPPPCRLFGQNAWTVRTLIRHIEERLAQSAAEAERTAQKIAQLAP